MPTVRGASSLLSLRPVLCRFNLKPDQNFYERDREGNEIIFKSVVTFRNNAQTKGDEVRKGIAFDLWFAYDITENQQLRKVTEPQN